nr:sugar nucleotide-binding protein [Shigella sp. FC1967]
MVNAAAYTNVDKAETDDINAFKINAESVEVIAKNS